MYSSRGPLHPPPGSGQRRAWWCGAENVPAILELFQSFHLHSCSTILLLGPSIFFSQGLTCSNLKGLMLTAKQPEIALHGATYSSVCTLLLFPKLAWCTVTTSSKKSEVPGTPTGRPGCCSPGGCDSLESIDTPWPSPDFNMATRLKAQQDMCSFSRPIILDLQRGVQQRSTSSVGNSTEGPLEGAGCWFGECRWPFCNKDVT